MKSIKRGRGPSMMEGIVGVFMAIFGVLWMIMAARIGGGFIALFGLVFVGIAIVNAVYSFRNAASKDRYSEYDITEGHEEPDPLNERFGSQPVKDFVNQNDGVESVYCPYCGTKVKQGYVYCNKCGKRLP